jgi:hypothetical protein
LKEKIYREVEDWQGRRLARPKTGKAEDGQGRRSKRKKEGKKKTKTQKFLRLFRLGG